MTKQPTYEVLEQRIAMLEREAVRRIQVEEELRNSEERYRVITELTTELIYQHDLEGNIKFLSPAWETIMGYSVEQGLSMNIREILTPGSYALASQSISERLRTDSQRRGEYYPPLNFQIELLRKDGSTFWAEITTKFIRDQDGNPVGIGGVARDITERKQTEEALQESEKRFRETAEMLPSVIIEYGLDGILTYVNPHGYKLADYGPEDFEEGFHVLRLVAPEEHKKHYERIQKMIQGETIPPVEYRLLRKDGSTFWGLVTSSLIHKDGKVVGVRSFTIDISDRKEAEEALKERTRELEAQKQSLEELNTAMKVLLKKREEDKTEIQENVMTNVKELIAPYFDKIKETKLDEQQKAFLSIIESNMNEIVSPFTRRLSLKYLKLTPTEIKIANMIKHGNTTKKIAGIMNISPRTVDTHRRNIRTKIGLESKRANLRSHLLTLH
jgi:PAS domain S-box-containing protein